MTKEVVAIWLDVEGTLFGAEMEDVIVNGAVCVPLLLLLLDIDDGCCDSCCGCPYSGVEEVAGEEGVDLTLTTALVEVVEG